MSDSRRCWPGLGSITTFPSSYATAGIFVAVSRVSASAPSGLRTTPPGRRLSLPMSVRRPSRARALSNARSLGRSSASAAYALAPAWPPRRSFQVVTPAARGLPRGRPSFRDIGRSALVRSPPVLAAAARNLLRCEGSLIITATGIPDSAYAAGRPAAGQYAWGHHDLPVPRTSTEWDFRRGRQQGLEYASAPFSLRGLRTDSELWSSGTGRRLSHPYDQCGRRPSRARAAFGRAQPFESEVLGFGGVRQIAEWRRSLAAQAVLSES